MVKGEHVVRNIDELPRRLLTFTEVIISKYLFLATNSPKNVPDSVLHNHTQLDRPRPEGWIALGVC